MKTLRAFLYKHNGAFAGLLGLVLIMGASFHAMHQQFERCDAQSMGAEKAKISCEKIAKAPSVDLLGLLFSGMR